MCCGPCKSDPIIANFSILKGGYVPGEAIVFNVAIDNKSNREVKEMTVNLIQVIKFHATRKSRTCTRNVASIQFPKRIAERSMEKWDNSVLVIPPVCSSSNMTCRIIEVSYMVTFNFDASGVAVSTDITIPIVIGTIPMAIQANQMQPQLPFTYEADMFGPNTVQMPSENDAGADKGEMYESDANTFKPFYPYYKDYSINNK